MAEETENRRAKTEKAIESLHAMELVSTNPHVRTMAKRLRWRAETLVERGKKAFPSVFEQRIYVSAMRSWRRPAHPETIAACFHYFNDGRELSSADFRESGNGRRILEKTGQTLLLMKRGFIAKDTAMRLIERCGDAEEVYNLVGEALQEIMRLRGIKTASREAMIAMMKAIAYGHEEHPELFLLDVVNTEDVMGILDPFNSFNEGRAEYEEDE